MACPMVQNTTLQQPHRQCHDIISGSSKLQAPVTDPTGGSDVDIEWDPSYETYIKRVQDLATHQGRDDLPTAVPSNMLTAIESPRVWAGADIDDPSLFVYSLSPHDLREINDAVQSFLAAHEDANPDLISPANFSLPSLGPKLREISRKIHFGRGFYIIRGLDPSQLSARDKVVAYVGLTSYIAGTRACQDAGGSKILHIKDRGMAFPGAEMRQAPYSNVAQPFHSDVCDILAMYFVELAALGGNFKIASTGKIYNDIAKTRPDVIQTLASPDWAFDKFTKDPAWDLRPLLYDFGTPHGPSFQFSRRPLTGSSVAPRTPGTPGLTERQAEALDMVHFTAVANQLTLETRRGDIVLVNNLAVLHARDAFVDGVPGGTSGRHVLRMWLRNEELAWPTPAPLRDIWDQNYSIHSPWHKRVVWHMEPPTVPERMLFRKFACS